MKFLNFNQEPVVPPKINKKKVIISIVIILILIFCVGIFLGYAYNTDFRNFFDIYFFRKNLSSEDVPKIDINSEDNDHIFGYDKYIAILNKNILSAYNSSGKKEFQLDISIGTPISNSNNRFLALAEKGGQKVYLIANQNISWQTDIEGQISNISVNKNGYVTLTVTGTSYKTVIITFDPSGKELFKTYLYKTTVADTDISNDNKYLAIAEVDTTGNLIQSNIKLVSIEKAMSDPQNSFDYIYPANSGELITNIYYQDKNQLVCMYDNSIHIVENNSDRKLIDIANKKDIFSDISLKSTVALITEKSSGLFADVQLQIININSGKSNYYNMTGVPKSVKTKDNIIALNLGVEIHFVDCNNGWLIKKYSSNQEVRNIILGSNIAAIVYQDKIELISL